MAKQMTLAEISKKMSGIDIAILSTHSDNGEIANRADEQRRRRRIRRRLVYFTYEEAQSVTDIARDPKVGLGFSGKGGFFSGTGIYVCVEGRAELIRDKAAFKRHWTSDLDQWFDKGVDTPNLVLIKVHAKRIKYWDAGDEGEIVL